MYHYISKIVSQKKIALVLRCGAKSETEDNLEPSLVLKTCIKNLRNKKPGTCPTWFRRGKL